MKKTKIVLPFIMSISLIVTSIPTNIFANDVISSQNNIYSKNLVEILEIDGINYKYEMYYNENGEETTAITNMNSLETKILTTNSEGVFVDGQKIGEINISQSDENDAVTFTDWILLGKVGHIYISWAAGTSAAVIVGLIANKLKIPNNFVKECLQIALPTLVGACTGGTLHFSNYYRNLPFGQTQYRTDWSFVASTGDRYGTFTYLSLPI